MAKFCTKCGAPLPEGSKFCAKCGTKVDDPIEAVPQPKPQPMPEPPREPLGIPDNSSHINWTPIITASVIGVVVIVVVILFLSRDSSSPEEEYAATDTVVATEEVLAVQEEAMDSAIVEEVVAVEEVPSPSSNVAPPYASGKFHGDFDGYPITVWLNTDADGNVTGKYCYDRVIAKYGDTPKAYFTLKGRFIDEYDAGHSWNLTSYQHGSNQPFETINLNREGDDFGGTAVNCQSDKHGTYYITLYE